LKLSGTLKKGVKAVILALCGLKGRVLWKNMIVSGGFDTSIAIEV
jgi:hypothetical protein